MIEITEDLIEQLYENEKGFEPMYDLLFNSCLCCGVQVPEGRQLCPACERGDKF